MGYKETEGKYGKSWVLPFDRVDGSKIPLPVDIVNISLFTGFDKSQVVQDFSHQQ